MDDKPEKQLTEKIKHCQKTARNLKQEKESLLEKQKSTNTRLADIDLAMKSNQQQLKLALEQYLSTQLDLPTSKDRLMIQSDANQKQIAKVTINQQGKLSDDNKDQNEAKLNQIVQALFTGTLPDDFFLHLLSIMGLQECLLSNRLVCSLWNELVLERCSNQKSLKLFETFNCLMSYGEALLQFEKSDDPSLILKSIGDDLLFEGPGIDHEQLVKSLHQNDKGDIQKEALTRKKKLDASKVLTALFPRVENLILCTEQHTLINIEHLLQFYAGQLTSLTVNSFGNWRESPDKLRAFSFPKLKSLNTFRFSPQDDQLLSLLPQLESLTLGEITSKEISLETLLRTGTQLRELNAGFIYSVYTAPVEEFSKRPPISTNLRKFSAGEALDELQVLEFISLNLTSLECLKLDLIFGQNNVHYLHSLSPYLVPLTQLHSLTLQACLSFFLLDETQLAEIKPLLSVRHLKLLLWNYDSLPRDSMDLFSRSLFIAFPNAEQVQIAFVGYVGEDADSFEYDGHVDAATLAAFEDFALKHPNVVQLVRSKDMSKLTNLPNAVSPLLGHHRQVYEEYIEEEELFGVAICQLTASLITPEGEGGPNLKSALRPADRLTAMSNLFQLLESKAFAFAVNMVNKMLKQMAECALKYGPSQGALFIVTSKCVLFLLDCRVVDSFDSDKEKHFLDAHNCHVYPFFEILLNLVKHHMAQQYDDKELFLQLCKRMVELLKEQFDSFKKFGDFDEFKVFKILLKLANYYKTQQLNVLDIEEQVLLQIDNLVDDQLQKFESEKRLDRVVGKLIGSKNRVYRVEMVRALLRLCNSTDDYFNWLSGEADSDSSDSDGSSSSAEDEL